MPNKEYPFIGGRPLIPIIIENPISKVEVFAMALIDSGADTCLFPAFVAADLGYELTTGVL